MSLQLNARAFRKLIDEDVAWLRMQERTSERDHIEAVLEARVQEYEAHTNADTEPSWLNAVAGVNTLLRHLGQDTSRDGLTDTPLRVVKAMREMTSGYDMDPRVILSTTFEESCDEIIILRDIEFVSLCEHHLLPFVGVAHVGYIPGKVVGLSKLARLVECFAKRLQIQERMTKQIAESLSEHAEAKGVGVIVQATHSCMAVRGVRKPGAKMITSSMLGLMRDVPEARAEFMRLVT